MEQWKPRFLRALSTSKGTDRRTYTLTAELLTPRDFVSDLIETRIGENYVKVRVELLDHPSGPEIQKA